MSRDDITDLALLCLAAMAIAALALTRQYLKPLPIHRRVWVKARMVVGR